MQTFDPKRSSGLQCCGGLSGWELLAHAEIKDAGEILSFGQIP